MTALPWTYFTESFHVSQSSSSLIKNPINMLGSISRTCNLRSRLVWHESMSSFEYFSTSSWKGKAGLVKCGSR